MNAKNLFLLSLTLLFSLDIIAQNDNEDCGFTPSLQQLNWYTSPRSPENKIFRALQELTPAEKQRMTSIYWENRQARFLFASTAIKQQIPIVAHVIRRSNKTGGLSVSDIKQSVDRLNQLFSNTKFIFELCETKFINDDALFNQYYTYKAAQAGYPPMYEILDVKNRNVSEKINIYIYEQGITSWANFPNDDPNHQHIMMLAEHMKDASTLAHEIGHWFDLAHTHETAWGAELVDGSNCSTAGDLICDTPADPKLTIENVNANTCAFQPGPIVARDANGMTYDSQPKNLMAYGRKDCRDRFSAEQKDRMYAAYFALQLRRGYVLKPCD